MFKFLSALLGLCFLYTPVRAQSSTIDDDVNNLNVIPIEKKLEQKRISNQKIDYMSRNYTPGELRDIIKNTNQLNKRSAKDLNKKAPQEAKVNVKNRNSVKEYLRQQQNTDTDGPDFFEGYEY